MSEEFDREALFSDIDKIMEKQGYSNIVSKSEPIEIAADDTGVVSSMAPQDLIDRIEKVVNPVTPDEFKSNSDSDSASVLETGISATPEAMIEEEPEIILTEAPEYIPEPAAQAPATPEEPVVILSEEPKESASIDLDEPVVRIGGEPEEASLEESKAPPQEEPLVESTSRVETSPMFTTIEDPIDLESNASKKNEEPSFSSGPAVSYLEEASSDGIPVENVAFGDISVGVETESVEFSIGHPLLRLLRNILICVAAALLISLLITKFIAHHTSVDGSSMQTTLTDGDQLIVEQLSYYFHDPERFDIIVFPTANEDDYIKRVIGLPGETVQIRDGLVYINGSQLTDDHYGTGLMEDPGTAADVIYLQKDEYFVLGDNRNASIDSRFPEVGLIKRDSIKGRAFFRFFPFSGFGTIS